MCKHCKQIASDPVTSDTPITDAHMKKLPYNWDYFDHETETLMRSMERELSELKRKHDRLWLAIDSYRAAEGWTDSDDEWNHIVGELNAAMQ